MKISTACITRGRPREFDTEQALAAALSVFWAKGYEGASMADLTEAMGITKPSLYAAFGNKEALFTKALDLYQREKLAYVSEALKASTARGVAEHFLHGALEIYSGEKCRGCLTVIGASACGDEAEGIREQVVARGAAAKQALLERFERAKQDGDLPANVDPQGLAAYLTAVLQGMSVQAGAGASRAELEQLVEICLATWPSA
ncbi:MAG: TetR family transcriptional regulator [Sphingomonadales bacterium 63-6]|nr:MAG: TetR family transcriptional regulator [Sphingomonadales bacterium 63-6]